MLSFRMAYFSIYSFNQFYSNLFMKRLFAICLAVLGCAQISSVAAQSAACTSPIQGTWRVDGASSSYIKIVPQSGCSFSGTIKTGAATTAVTGSFANNKTITLVETATKITYTGELQSDGSIRGTGSNNAKFTWVKVCDQTKYSQKTVSREYFGEKRNEAIPLVSGSDAIPPGAIFKGNIGIDSKTVVVSNSAASDECNTFDPAPAARVSKPRMTLKR